MKIKKLTPESYPTRLQNISSRPKQLFYLGDIDLLQTTTVAVVGSRKMTHYGRYVTEKITRELAEARVTIVSGLALGIDGLAHKTALDNDTKTIAVMPCGLDMIYPNTHRSLAQRILANGGLLVSEYPAGVGAFVQNFPARNRIISALAQAVVIPEAAERSGSLITANFALEQGVSIYAVPGPINSPSSAGCNNLILTGAEPCLRSSQILDFLGLKRADDYRNLKSSSKEEELVLGAITDGINSADLIEAATGLSTAEMNQAITMLEINGVIVALGADKWGLN